MKEKLSPNNRGITLIALIITIIVMLILVAVTITVAVNGGLFEYAGRAGKGTNEEIKDEQLLAEGIINEQTIDDIVGIAVKDDWYGKPATELPTDEDGNYHIKTCAELAKFASMVNDDGNEFEEKTVYLDKNLDLQGNESKQWTPIGVDDWHTFNGIFDGQNHYISGVYINNDEFTEVGLFGNIDGKASIQNIGITKGYISGKYVAGGIIGCNNSGNAKVKNCYNLSEISGETAGGIIGFSVSDYYIENCYNEGNIHGTAAGGILGSSINTSIINCYNKGSIISEAGSAGGILGDSIGTIEIENCYNLGKVSGDSAGEIYGGLEGIRIANCYFLLSLNNNSVEGKTEAEMKSSDFVTRLNNEGTAWKLDTNNINDGYPILFWQK